MCVSCALTAVGLPGRLRMHTVCTKARDLECMRRRGAGRGVWLWTDFILRMRPCVVKHQGTVLSWCRGRSLCRPVAPPHPKH